MHIVVLHSAHGRFGSKVTGIFYGTNMVATTWFAVTPAIFESVGADPGRVFATDSASFKRLAPRPTCSVLGQGKWAAVGMVPIRDWWEAHVAARTDFLTR